MRRQGKQKPTTPAALPPIPQDTPEGIRAHAIAETLRALDYCPTHNESGLGLQSEDVLDIAGRLQVPAVFIESVIAERSRGSSAVGEQRLDEFVHWRLRLGEKTEA
jgi:hypothetical protein